MTCAGQKTRLHKGAAREGLEEGLLQEVQYLGPHMHQHLSTGVTSQDRGRESRRGASMQSSHIVQQRTLRLWQPPEALRRRGYQS